MSHRRMSYTASEKLAIVKYAEAHSNRAAGRQYDGVSESHIRLWRQLKERLILPCVLYTCTLILPMTRRPQSYTRVRIIIEIIRYSVPYRSQWSSGITLACSARDPRFESRCRQKFVFMKITAAFGMGCRLTAVPRSTQLPPSEGW